MLYSQAIRSSGRTGTVFCLVDGEEGGIKQTPGGAYLCRSCGKEPGTSYGKLIRTHRVSSME